MSSDLEAELAHKLRVAAESAVQPAPGALYVGAVDRGRRIRRTVIIKRALAGVAVLGVVTAVGVPLLGGASGTAPVGTASPSNSKAGAGAALIGAAAPSGTKAVARTPAGTAWMPAYVEQTLKSLLPAGSTTEKQADLGGVPLQVSAPDVQAPGGESLALVRTDLETPNGRSTITLSVGKYAAKPDCPSPAVAPHDICTTTPLAGGTLYVDKSFKDYTHGTGAAIWTLNWNGPDGQSVYLGESTDAPTQALTVRQAENLLAAPAWDQVWKSLPATCRFGAMPNPHVTQAEVETQTNVFVCATSKAVAMRG